MLSSAGFCGLKGHKSLGGLRASMYNSLEYESVEALVTFLQDYQSIASNADLNIQGSVLSEEKPINKTLCW